MFNLLRRPVHDLWWILRIVIVVFLVPHQTHAARPLRIATIQSPPLGYVSDNGESRGLYFEIASRIAETAGFSYTNRVLPFARAITSLEHGEADMSVFFRREGNSRLVPLAAVYVLKIVAIGAQGTRFNTLVDLYGKNVAKMRRTDYGPSFENDPAITKVETNNYLQGIVMLMEGRVDAAVGPEIGFFFAARQAGYAREHFGPPLEVGRREVWVQASAATVDVTRQAALRAAIKTLLADGTIQKIIEKYDDE